MKTRLVHGLRHHHAEPTDHLGANRDAQQRRGPARIIALAGREHRRDDHRAGVHGPTLERVVEILAVRGRAVDEGGAGGAHGACMADRRARPLLVPPCKRGLDVILVARGETEPDNVDGQVLAFAAHSCGQPRRVQRRDPARQNLSERSRGKGIVHGILHRPAQPEGDRVSFSGMSGVTQAGIAEAGNAIDRDNDGEGDDKHDQAEHRDGAEVSRFR